MLACLLLFGSPAGAQDWDDEAEFTDLGGYISAGYSYAAENVKSRIGRNEGDKKGWQDVDGNVDDAMGVNLVFGYRSLEFFSVEAEYEFLDGFDFTNTSGEDFEVQVHTAMVNSKLFLFHPWLKDFHKGRLQPSAHFGFGIMFADDLDISASRSFTIRAGGAIDYFVNYQWSVFAKTSYVIPFGNLQGLRYLSTTAGVSYHFY